ncbi:MAG TPA: glycosyltransferase [Hyphomicrobiaceae bacterium]|nr:glycosyltransferase [Hyphomicrobiaceae bacterium]
MSLHIGGTERQLAQILPAVARMPADVRILALLDRGALAPDLARSGVFVSGPGPLGAPPPRSRMLRALRFIGGVARLVGQLFFHRPQIVNFYLTLPYLVGAPLALLARVPHIVMSRRGLNTHFARYPGARTIERWLHPAVTIFLANSRAVLRQLLEEGVPAERTGLINNGIDLAPFDTPFDRLKARAKLGIPASAPVIVMVANLHAYKGHRDLLEALAAIAGRLDPDWMLLLAGRDEGAGPSLRAMARNLAIADHVRFLGQRSDVPALLRLADLAVHCSYEEGSSNAILEAMAAGLPLVVTDAGGNAEAVLDGVNGLVVPPRDPLALAAAILRMMENRELASRFGAASRARASAEYSLALCIEKHLRLYRALLAGDRPIAAVSADISVNPSA